MALFTGADAVHCNMSVDNYMESITSARWNKQALPNLIQMQILESLCGASVFWNKPSIVVMEITKQGTRVQGFSLTGKSCLQLWLDKVNLFMGAPKVNKHRLVCFDRNASRMWVCISEYIVEVDGNGLVRRFVTTPIEMEGEKGEPYAVCPTGVDYIQGQNQGPGNDFIYVRLGRDELGWGIKFALDESTDDYEGLTEDEVNEVSFVKEHNWLIKGRITATHRETGQRFEFQSGEWERIIEVLDCKEMPNTHVWILMKKTTKRGATTYVGLYDWVEGRFEWKMPFVDISRANMGVEDLRLLGIFN